MITTLAEIREYRDGDRIECLECRKSFGRLTHTHLLIHEMTADDYRAKHGIPWTWSLTSATSREATRRTVTPQHIANLTSHCGPLNKGHRPHAPAVRADWSGNAELGRDASARLRVQ